MKTRSKGPWSSSSERSAGPSITLMWLSSPAAAMLPRATLAWCGSTSSEMMAPPLGSPAAMAMAE